MEAHDVGVDGPHGVLLEPTSLRLAGGEVAVVTRPPGHGHTVLTLAVSGRLVPDRGRVLLDGRADPAGLRRRVAPVDVPDVSAPEDALPLHAVIGEELAVARRPAGRAAVRAWLAERRAGEWERARLEEVDPDVRMALLAELAALRPGVEAVAICCPDRYGASPHACLGVARELAGHGLAVLLQLTSNTALAIADEPELTPQPTEPIQPTQGGAR